MSFFSPAFLIFLIATLLCFFISPRKFRWCVLLISSILFYWLLGSWTALVAISFTILTVHFSAIWAGMLRKNSAKQALRRVPLALCLTLNFGMLAFFKFGAFVFPTWGVIMITGVSFYTFQAAGYLIDVYKGKEAPEKNPFKTALFLSFFPQLIQGPISRHADIARDLFAGHGWDWDRSRSGMQRIIWGYFMKLVVANYADPIVNTVFAGYRDFGGVIIIFAVLVYGIQIYADFAGGISIALGIAEIVGVKLPENFRQPLFANSLADFWRRWHITLGTWLRDYFFYSVALSRPIGKLGRLTRKIFGNSVGKMIPVFIATFCVYIVVGVWHSTGRHLPVFGLLNGVLISASLIAEPVMVKLRAKTGIDGTRSGVGRVFAILRTFAILGILRYFVRAGSPMEALRMLRYTLFNLHINELWNGTLLNLGVDIADYVILVAGIIVLRARDLITERGTDCSQMLNEARPIVQFAVMLAAFSSIIVFGFYSGRALSATFIYAGF